MAQFQKNITQIETSFQNLNPNHDRRAPPPGRRHRVAASGPQARLNPRADEDKHRPTTPRHHLATPCNRHNSRRILAAGPGTESTQKTKTGLLLREDYISTLGSGP